MSGLPNSGSASEGSQRGRPKARADHASSLPIWCAVFTDAQCSCNPAPALKRHAFVVLEGFPHISLGRRWGQNKVCGLSRRHPSWLCLGGNSRLHGVGTNPFERSMSLQVLIADDEPDVLHMVSQSLTSAGFQVARASDGQEALDKARRSCPAVVVLDLMMPKLSGTDVLRALKGDPRTMGIPVIVLTACKDEVDRIVSLELGADDYVTKPFSPRELTLRIKAIVARRSVSQPASPVSAIGQISIDRDAHEVRVKGRRIDATTVEYKLLNALCRHPGKVFSREELLDAVWGEETEVEVRTVDTHLRRLRGKLGAAAKQVQTIRGFGYRLDSAED